MSDAKATDKDKKDTSSGDGSGNDAGEKSATTLPFGELLGHIDSRIEAAFSRRSAKTGSGTGDTKSDSADPSAPDPQSVREQLKAELAKLKSEEDAAKKEADRDVTIEELKASVEAIKEGAPVQQVSKLTKFMWGDKKK